MALTTAQIRALKSNEKPFKVADGKGLYIEVFPNGSKLWRWKYRYGGKEKRLALGSFPEVGVAEARRKRDDERAKLHLGVDPALERKRARLAAKSGASNTFADVANEYINKMEAEGRAAATLNKAKWFLSLLQPAIGVMPIGEIDAPLLLAPLKRLEDKGNLETAKKVLSFAGRVFRYAIATGRAKANPADHLKGALTAPKAKHFAAILEPARLGDLLRAIDAYTGSLVTRRALQIAPHVFLRPGELRQGRWDEVDLDAAIWTIPAERMKGRHTHTFPLSRQVVDLLRQLQSETGPDGFMFPTAHDPRRPMSENTLNQAFRRMGFSKDEVSAHGFRATASSLLNETGEWNPDAIERALAHKGSDAVRAAYHRGQHWAERVQMAQWWSDYLDGLKDTNNVIPMKVVKV